MLEGLGAGPGRTTAGPLTLGLALRERPGERRPDAPPDLRVCLPAGDRPEGPGPRLRGDGLAGQPAGRGPFLAHDRAGLRLGAHSDSLGDGVPKPWKPEGVPASDLAVRSGDVVFHDAWPERWPRLVLDIVNSHHPTYYRQEGPPGDWDSPVPVYFLAIPPGQRFSFALNAGVPASRVSTSRSVWHGRRLDGVLSHLGCGAKTAAGYGTFTAPGPGDEAVRRPSRRPGRVP